MDNSKVNTIFAFLLALQDLKVSPQEELLVKLRHKIHREGFADWENIEEKLELILKEVANLRDKYEHFLSQLENCVIGEDLSLSQPEAYSVLPTKPKNGNRGTLRNVLAVAEKTKKVLENTSDKTQLQTVRDFLEKQSQKEQHQKR